MDPVLTVLVVDDSEINRRLLQRFLQQLGHEVALACNGEEAVIYCKGEPPDVIFMDVVMPVMDGYQATSAIRALLGEHWVPIVFLTALDEHEGLKKALEIGGDDYLTKPLNLATLAVKMKVLQRFSNIQRQLRASANELTHYYQLNEQENQLAQHVVAKFLKNDHQQYPNMHCWVKPALSFSGDVTAVARTPTGIDHILLADCTGHGLAAAITSLAVVDAFVSMTRKGFGISAIASVINRKLHVMLPVGRFVAAALASIDYRERILALWNGGIPCAIFIDSDGMVNKVFPSQYPPLGILDEASFESGTELYRWDNGGSVLLCSDGVIEASNPQGREFCQAPCDHIPIRSWPLFKAREVLHSIVNDITRSPKA